MRIKLATLAPAIEGFSVPGYLAAKSAAIAATQAPPSKEKLKTPKEAKAPKEKSAPPELSKDVLVPELFEHLREWRMKIAKEQEVPAYVVAWTRTLIAIANTMPADTDALKAIHGVGKAFLQKYGVDVLAIVQDYRDGKI